MSVLDEAKAVLEELLTKMGLEAQVAGKDDGEHVTLDVGGPETGLVIGKKGMTLDALQYLVNKIVSLRLDDENESKPIHLDCEGYRARRAEALVELAHQLADQARKTGRPVAADPMSPADRRVIHVALADAEGLTTRSEGEGIHRHLVVIPTGTQPGSEGPK